MKNFLLLPLILFVIFSLNSMEDPRKGLRKELQLQQPSSSSSPVLFSSLIKSDIDDTAINDSEHQLAEHHSFFYFDTLIEKFLLLNEGSFSKAHFSINNSEFSEPFKEKLHAVLSYAVKHKQLLPVMSSDKKIVIFTEPLISQSRTVRNLLKSSSYDEGELSQFIFNTEELSRIQNLTISIYREGLNLKEAQDRNKIKELCMKQLKDSADIIGLYVLYTVADYLGILKLLERIEQIIIDKADFCKLIDDTTPFLSLILKTYPKSLAFSPDNNFLVLIRDSGLRSIIEIWNLNSKKREKTLDRYQQYDSITYTSKGTICAFSVVGSFADDRDYNILKWNPNNDRYTTNNSGHFDSCRFVAINREGTLIAFCTNEGVITVTSEESAPILGKHKNAFTLTFSPLDTFLASGSTNKIVKVWDIASRRCIKKLKGHVDSVNLISFSDNENILATASFDKTIKIWDLTSDSDHCIQTLEGQNGSTNQMIFHPKNNFLALSSGDNTIKIWNINSGKCIQILASMQPVRGMAFSPNGNFFARSLDNKMVKIYSMYDTKEVTASIFLLMKYAYEAHKEGKRVDLNSFLELKKIYFGCCEDFRKFIDQYIIFKPQEIDSEKQQSSNCCVS